MDKKDKDLEIIALTDREWNRQQVSFEPDSKHIEITGGDGFEKAIYIQPQLLRIV